MHDLAKMLTETTESHKNNVMQIAEFTLVNPKNWDSSQGKEQAHYAINASKIKTIEFYSEARVKKNISGADGLVQDFCVVRGETYPVINIAKWLGMETITDANEKMTDTYSIILAEFNQTKVAFPVYRVGKIHRKKADELDQESILEKLSYVTKINVEKRVNKKIETNEVLCFIVDVEMLLVDALGAQYEREIETLQEISTTDKKILVAEDSKTARNIMSSILEKLNVKYEIFNDGAEILNFLNERDNSDVGLVITDIEMPNKDGFQVLSEIRDSKTLNSIPVVMNTSMSNVGVQEKAMALGANGFIPKTSPQDIKEVIEEFMAA